MTEKLMTSGAAANRASFSARRLRESVARRLSRIEQGRLVVRDPLGDYACGQSDADASLSATIDIKVLDAYIDIALGGNLGAGESYMRGDWRCDRLTDLVRILLRNREVLQGLDSSPLALLRKPLLALLRWRSANTRRGARRNIAAHYDLGNELFQLFLDPLMMYSSAVYPHADTDLDSAARYKVDLVCRKLDLGPGDHLLEIGSGWGGLAIHAARHYGCRVTTTTISQRQYELASARIDAAGLGHRIELLKRDYRDLEGRYDKLVSIEMIEAVGHENYEEYFRRCDELLAPGGVMLLQAITISDRQYERARKHVDFIKRYIFPGGCLPSTTALQQALTRASALQIVDIHDIGADYARTLAHWRERFEQRLNEVRALGYDQRFVRMWTYYLCYCEGAFLERATSAAQYLLVSPEARQTPGWRLS